MIEFEYKVESAGKIYPLKCKLIQQSHTDILVIGSKKAEVRVQFNENLWPYVSYGRKTLKYKVVYGEVKDLQMLDSFVWAIVKYLRETYYMREDKGIHPKNDTSPL